MDPAVQSRIAEVLILESTSHMGSFIDSGDVAWCLHHFGRKLRGGIGGFDGRRFQPFKSAVFLVANSRFSSMSPRDLDDENQILAGGAAVATPYLFAQLEHLFRLNSRYLSVDGTVVRQPPRQLVNKAKLRAHQARVSQIKQAFVMYKYRNTSNLGRRLRRLDEKLRITARLSLLRNPAMHGELADAGFESKFLALMCAMFYYTEVIIVDSGTP